MLKCHNCSEQNPDGVKVCQNCSLPLTPVNVISSNNFTTNRTKKVHASPGVVIQFDPKKHRRKKKQQQKKLKKMQSNNSFVTYVFWGVLVMLFILGVVSIF